jgi:enterochelin esterase-like enzyme
MKSRIQLIICSFIALIVETNSFFSQVTKGEIIEIKNFQSKYVDSRTISIWLPEGYVSLKKYPVLYMNEGQMLF